jgi:hypothetical protein
MPECFVSACSTDSFEDYVEYIWDFDGCTEVATHTATTDFSQSPGPDSCFIDSSAVDTASSNLATEVLADVNACTNSPCVFNVDTYPEYSAMVDACESARGALHLFSVVLTCTSPSLTFQFNDYPDCLTSQSQNPDCTASISESYMESLWDFEGCTASATHMAVVDYSVNGSGSFLAQKSGCGIILALIISLACATWM